MRLLIAGNVRPGHPGRYHFLQGTCPEGLLGISWGQEIHQLLPEDPPATHGHTSYYHLHKLPTLFLITV